MKLMSVILHNQVVDVRIKVDIVLTLSIRHQPAEGSEDGNVKN